MRSHMVKLIVLSALTAGIVLAVGTVFAAPAVLQTPGTLTPRAYLPLILGPPCWFPAGSMSVARTGHTATLLPSGKVLVVGGETNGQYYAGSAELYDPASNSWSPAGSMSTARTRHTATLLPSGKVLVVGGENGGCYGGGVDSAELYDPASNSWSPAGSMSTAHTGHTVTLLPLGKVLVVGGSDGRCGYTRGAVDVYDAATNTWSAGGSLATGQSGHTATLLPSGKVLVTGGFAFDYPPGYTLARATLYDPGTNDWSSAGSMSTPRYGHAATLLTSGKVLAVGGFCDGCDVHSAELYDPTSNSWSPAGSMSHFIFKNTATVLPSGKVLVVGYNGVPTSAELYDPAVNSWSPTGSMSTAHSGPTVILLHSGKVLVVGGGGGWGADASYLTSAELYNPGTNSWSLAGSMSTVRTGHTATLLPSGKVLVVGGRNGSGSDAVYLASAELYDP